MPLVFSPPPRRIRTRSARPASSSSRLPHSVRPAARIGALVGVAALVLSGCTSEPEEHTLATPTAATPTETEGAGPEYTTDLQLSEEEKKAVEHSLAALNRYVDVSNEVFGAGGEGAEKFDEVARDSRLVAAKGEAESLKSDNVQMTGKFRITESDIFEVDLDMSDDTAVPFVKVHSCVPGHEFSYSDIQSTSSATPEDKFDTFEFVIAEYDGDWFVSEQYLWDSGCEF